MSVFAHYKVINEETDEVHDFTNKAKAREKIRALEKRWTSWSAQTYDASNEIRIDAGADIPGWASNLGA